MLKSILLVGIGSFFGGALRYVIATLMKDVCGQGFPWGTLVVNLLGSFVFGVIFALFAKYSSINSPWCLLFTTGVCGGFTTFSSFVHESLQMLYSGNISGFVTYVAMSLIVGIVLMIFAYWMVK